MQVNYMLTIGDKELETQLLAVRTRDNRVLNAISVEHFTNAILDELHSLSLSSSL